jgi:nucleoside-diphosphate-sugar epimerase
VFLPPTSTSTTETKNILVKPLCPRSSKKMSLPASNGKTVLISGINGYIASNIGLDLLRKGYTVRGTSRSTSAKDDLLRGAFKGYESRYEHEVVPDITATGAFDKAVKGRSAMKIQAVFRLLALADRCHYHSRRTCYHAHGFSTRFFPQNH